MNPKVDEYGTKRWLNNNEEFHRENDLPAIEYSNGDKWYFQKGRLHRLKGPAIHLADGTKRWYINNVRYTEEEFNEKVKGIK